jgi:hypothetical protein
MRFGTWNVRSLYSAGSSKTVSSKSPKCNLDVVAVREVRWIKGVSQPTDDYTFFYGNVNASHHRHLSLLCS